MQVRPPPPARPFNRPIHPTWVAPVLGSAMRHRVWRPDFPGEYGPPGRTVDGVMIFSFPHPFFLEVKVLAASVVSDSSQPHGL